MAILYDINTGGGGGGGGGGGTVTVVDNLTSTSTTSALSANQGRVLKNLVDSKANTSAIPDELKDLASDSTHRTVTDTEKSTWNNKANSSDIPTSLSQLSADSTHRLVTDTEKSTWNGKSVVSVNQIKSSGERIASITINGTTTDLYASAGGGGTGGGAVDSVNGQTGTVVLNGTDIDLASPIGTSTTVEAALNSINSSIPTTLSQLSTDSTHRVVTDTEKSTWNGKSVVSINRIKTSGEKIATITINGTATDIYASSGGSGAVSSVNGQTGTVVLDGGDINLETPLSLLSGTASTVESASHRAEWSATATVAADKTVTFTGLNDNYGYTLYCQDKLVTVASMTKTGSGTSMQLVYTLNDATQGDSCKLQIMK